MIGRREFLAALAAFAAVPGSRQYTIQAFRLKDAHELPKLRRSLADAELVLQAIVAPHLPELLAIYAGPPGRSPNFRLQAPGRAMLGDVKTLASRDIVELRSYDRAAPPACVLRRCGIIPAFTAPDAHLIAFDSLAARERAWAALAADRDWSRIRSEFRLSGVALYRAS